MEARTRNRLATVLFVGSWLGFVSWQTTAMIRENPGVALKPLIKDVWAAFSYLAVLSLVAGIAVAARETPARWREDRGFTRLLMVLSGICFAGALLEQWALSFGMPGDAAPPLAAALRFARNVLLGSGAALAFAVHERRSDMRTAPAISAASGICLLLVPPILTPLGLWWLFRVRPRESIVS